jgi:hypothetical protein
VPRAIHTRCDSTIDPETSMATTIRTATTGPAECGERRGGAVGRPALS